MRTGLKIENIDKIELKKHKNTSLNIDVKN